MVEFIDLLQFRTDHRSRRFEWGQWDCYQLALRWHDRIANTHYARFFRGTYDSAESAVDRLMSFPSTAFVLEPRLVDWGWIRAEFARPGDLLLINLGQVYDCCHIVYTEDTVLTLPIDSHLKTRRLGMLEGNPRILRYARSD